MYMSFQKSVPWLFHRDEIDLLEEDLDLLYYRFRSKSAKQSMEQSLIQEQMETEDLFHAEFPLQMDIKTFLVGNKSLFSETPCEFDQDFSVKQLLADDMRSPFYSQIFLWSKDVCAKAQKIYQKGDDRAKDAFCIFVNAKIIPIKIACAIEEEAQENPFAFEVAKKDYQLALIYLNRIQNAFIRLSHVKTGVFVSTNKMGVFLEQAIKQSIERISRRSNGLSSGFYEDAH